MTASRILAGGSLRSKARERVLASARELGYVRNQHAANLRTGRSRLIGVMVPFIDNPFYTKFLQEIHDAFATHRYQCLIACSFGRSTAMLAAVELFAAYHVDGIVLDISEGAVTAEFSRRLRAWQRRARAIAVTGVPSHDLPFDHLYLDNGQAIAAVMQHLLAQGHRRIGFLGGHADNPNIANRLAAFRRALKGASLAAPPERIALGAPALDDVARRAAELLRLPDRPTAVVCTSDMMAMVAIQAARDAGLRVPQDLAVTGFDDIDQASLLNPRLTTVRQPLRPMAVAIADMLLARLGKRSAPVQERRYEADLIVRESA